MSIKTGCKIWGLRSRLQNPLERVGLALRGFCNLRPRPQIFRSVLPSTPLRKIWDRVAVNLCRSMHVLVISSRSFGEIWRQFFLSLCRDVQICHLVIFCVSVSIFFGSLSQVLAASRARTNSEPLDGKRVIAIIPPENLSIEMPDRSLRSFGEGYDAGLVTYLTQTEKFLVTDRSFTESQSSHLAESDPSEKYVWHGSVTPIVTVRTQVNGLSFQTGSGGERMFYGFSPQNKTPFNDGTGRLKNEFPLQPGGFGASFDRKGIPPFDSQSGLDLGDGFNLDALFAWLTVKYARYHAEAHLSLSFEMPFYAGTRVQAVDVQGEGYFFDLAGAYQEYSGGIMVARTDAMEQAMRRAMQGAFQAIQEGLKNLPLVARVDAIAPSGQIFLGTGPSSSVRSGILFQSLKDPEVVVQVRSSMVSGSVASLLRGRLDQVQPDMVLVEVPQMPPLGTRIHLESASDGPSRVDAVQMPMVNIPQVGALPGISRILAFAKSLVEGVFLPYRIWRYFQYDQPYALRDRGRTPSPSIQKLFMGLPDQSWYKQIGMQSAHGSQGDGVTVAILDTGVDYNHPLFTASTSPLWRGWDFISGDRRPYDDSYHGTQLASLVSALAPAAHILPLKIFNPWGLTHSAALYSAWVYAVDHGARIILCGWSTVVRSRALEMGIQYARDHGVVVVTAAGDQGVTLQTRWNALYPAVYGRSYDNIVSVAAVDATDRLMKDGARASNYDPTWVEIAAPGQQIRVAEPRGSSTVTSSTDLSAALVAGALARLAAQDRLDLVNLTPQGSQARLLIDRMLSEAEIVPSLRSFVRGGLRLRVR